MLIAERDRQGGRPYFVCVGGIGVCTLLEENPSRWYSRAKPVCNAARCSTLTRFSKNYWFKREEGGVPGRVVSTSIPFFSDSCVCFFFSINNHTYFQLNSKEFSPSATLLCTSRGHRCLPPPSPPPRYTPLFLSRMGVQHSHDLSINNIL